MTQWTTPKQATSTPIFFGHTTCSTYCSRMQASLPLNSVENPAFCVASSDVETSPSALNDIPREKAVASSASRPHVSPPPYVPARCFPRSCARVKWGPNNMDNRCSAKTNRPSYETGTECVNSASIAVSRGARPGHKALGGQPETSNIVWWQLRSGCL